MVDHGDSTRTDAILDAAFEVVCEQGYDLLTMDAVAARAKASKATIYRHWPGKAQLVVDAVRCHAGTADACSDTGSLRGDLEALVGMLAAGMGGPERAVLAGLLAAAGRDPELAGLIKSVTTDKRPMWQAVVDRAVTRGELAADDAARCAEVLCEVAPAVAFFTVTMLGRPLDAAWQRHLVDDVLMPAVGAPMGTPTG